MFSKLSNKKLLIGSLLCATQAFGLEFGGMGNVSAGMGGAGVALKKSQWAVYYNPALLGSAKNAFGYSFGSRIHEDNLAKVANVDLKNLQALPAQINALFANENQQKAQAASLLAAAATQSATQGNNKLGGYFGNVIDNFLGNNGTGTNDKLNDVLKDVLTSAGVTPNNGNTSVEDFKNHLKGEKGPEIIDKFKEKLQDASQKAGGNIIFDSIINGLTQENISGLVDLVKDGNNGGSLTPDQIIDKLGGLNLALSGDANLDRAIKDLNTIQDTLKRNNFSFVSQSGLVVQLAPRDDVGGFGMGIFSSIFMNASASFDQSHNRLIVDANGKYVELQINGDQISFKPLGTTPPAPKNGDGKGEFEKHSVFSPNAKHHLDASGIVLVEVPVGYGHRFDVGVGEFSIGGTIKYLQGIGYGFSKVGDFDQIAHVEFPDVPTISQNFGIDLGALYSVAGFNVGLVAKNLNNPGFKLSDTKKIYLNPQLRAGISYEWGILNFVLDADLLPNKTLSYTAPKSQMMGGGLMVDLKFMDLRAGAMYDFRNPADTGVILTGGVNLFGFFDIAIQSSLYTTEVRQFKIPNYFSLVIGGGFSW